MRGTVPGLLIPYPIGGLLPAVYQEDSFTQRFTAGLDEVLAPVVSTLDCLDAYLDPALTPVDFLDWLGGWLGLDLAEHLTADRRRALLARAADLYRARGTAAGLREHLELVFGGRVEVTDTGGVVVGAAGSGWTDTGVQAQPALLVRIAPQAAVSPLLIEEFVARLKPAHVTHTVEVLQP
ncbi:phage tail protein [Kitasatospora mediocidica]|uniref:phage tail protein n=1 Tax=Kitasatospora mediocidica TaxID=58352 RepID=UPI000560CACC|nr:phage tail protein [Kitasatospora mediocidica]